MIVISVFNKSKYVEEILALSFKYFIFPNPNSALMYEKMLWQFLRHFLLILHKI